MKNTIIKTFFLIYVTFFFWGCVSAKYFPPKHENNLNNYSRTIEKTFDETWKNLIEYSASTFFSIDNFEKESGLLTLTFGSSNPSQFVTGGQWDANWGNNSFSGDYVDYLNQYQNGVLNGKMNIVVSQINENETKVTVNARYIFTATVYNNNNSYTSTWSFDTGNCGTINVNMATSGTSPERTICPTYKAENDILQSLE